MKWLGACLVVVAFASPAWAIYQSTFDEPLYTMNELLSGQDGWTGGSNYIWTDLWDGSGTVQINAGGSANSIAEHALDAADPTGVTTVDIDMLPGIGTAGTFAWAFRVLSDSGGLAAWWYGQTNTARARIGGTVADITGITDRITLRAVVDVSLGVTDYFYDKHDGNGMQFLTSLGGYTATSADKVQFEAWGRGDDSIWVFFDNLIPEPATLLLLGVGGLLGLRRRRA